MKQLMAGGGVALVGITLTVSYTHLDVYKRQVQNAKRNMGGILGARRVGGQWYNFIKKKQPPEPAS